MGGLRDFTEPLESGKRKKKKHAPLFLPVLLTLRASLVELGLGEKGTGLVAKLN